MSETLAGILLAAGQSTRFGSHKLLHLLPDTNTPMAVQAAQHLLQVLPYSVAVVRPEDVELKELLSQTGITLINNPQAHSGISTSIRCALNVLQRHSQGWLIALADMPYVPVSVYQQLVTAMQQGALISAPNFNGRRGHPVGFSSKLLPELLELQGDVGAKSVILKHSAQVQQIDVVTAGVIRDIDYPSQL